MKRIALAVAALALCAQAQAAVLFQDNLDNLNNWTRKAGWSFAYTTNNELHFSSGNSAGDIFSNQTFTRGYFNFEYKGTAGFDTSGYFGISAGFPGNHYWYAGGSVTYSTPVRLINDGQFHRYSVYFDNAVLGGAPAHLMLEQFAGNTPDVAVFRRLSVTDTAPVPEAETWAMLGLGLGALAMLRRRRQA
ncbi:PEP-CTERM sorting domain-containing protein [Massilia sp. W12]|uniref:PEP-CTERM sorting domain-containing protein n=1 Tax=Massilia sp. W12 TaxID=3126507 RepID=UPI0030D307D2